MALTDIAIRNAKPREKPYKMGDAGGLFLLVQPTGGKLWRLKYRVDGREKKLALGIYPGMSLADARASRDDAKRLIAAGVDPGIQKARTKLHAREARSNTFAAVAEDFIAKRLADGDRKWSERTETKQRRFLNRLNPFIGKLPITDITPPEILAAVKRIEASGQHESARRAVQLAGMVFRFGIQTGRATSDPTRDLRGALIAPTTRHRAAITDAVNAGALLRAIDAYSGSPAVLYALKLLPHVFVRPGELRHAEWNEFDFDNALWIIPAAKMKMRRAHAIPLSKQVLALLREWREFRNSASPYVFPSVRSTARPLSDNTINAGLRRLGFTADEMTAHGFRSMASTLLNEALDPKTKKALWTPDAIERSLAHGHDDKVRGAYHRGQHWEERVIMQQWWSDELDRLRRGADVIPLKRGARE